jgi:hypothetical protein
LIDNRESVARGSGKEQIREQNLRFGDRTMQWMSLQATKGDLPPVTIEIAHAIVFAPAEEICRRWLLGRQKAPSTFATALGNAAWAGLISLGRGNMQ